MRVLHVVTLVSPDNAYGGPLRVAVNQARALREAGHDVTVVAGATGFERLDDISVGGVPIRAFAARNVASPLGFAGLQSASLRRWLKRNLPSFDVVHVHFARDLIAVPAALSAMRAGVPLVLQTHGMVDRSSRALARILDAVFVKRILRAAGRVLFLTEHERAELESLAPGLSLAHVINGVPMADSPVEEDVHADQREVLFLARLHRRKNPVLFATAARIVAAEYPNVVFTLVGPDEGEAAAVVQVIDGHPQVRIEGGVDPDFVTQRVSRASLFVLPSVDEPFPMAVLEAMALAKPVVVTRSCGLAGAVMDADAGVVIEANEHSLADAMRLLLADPRSGTAAGERGRQAAVERFSMVAVASRLASIYREVGEV